MLLSMYPFGIKYGLAPFSHVGSFESLMISHARWKFAGMAVCDGSWRIDHCGSALMVKMRLGDFHEEHVRVERI